MVFGMRKTIYTQKNGSLAPGAMPGMASSLCFYVLSVIQALIGRRFSRKNTTFSADVLSFFWFVECLGVFLHLPLSER